MLFPYKRFKDIQGWIPEEDADGVDVKDIYVSDCENVDFENAFMKNAVEPQVVSFPTEVNNLISSGYSIKGVGHFIHDERGSTFLYVMYKSDSGHIVKFIVSDSEGTTIELNIDEQNSDVTFTGEPTDIVFALEDNQLKVNLNIAVNYTTLNKLVMGNLTLIYLDTITYIENVTERSAGWYLFPRWLGWSYDEDLVYQWAEGALEDFEDGTYEYNISFPTPTSIIKPFTTDGTYAKEGSQSIFSTSTGTILTVSGGTQNYPHYRMDMIPTDPKVLTFWARTDENAPANLSFIVVIGGVESVLESWVVDTGGEWEKFTAEARLVGSIDRFELRQTINKITRYTVTIVPPFILPDQFQFNRLNIDALSWAETAEELDATIVAKYVDGQRARLQNGFLSPFTLTVDEKEIDWRVVAYEVYRVPAAGGTQVLWSVVTPEDNVWTTDSGILSTPISLKETTTSLVFNYSLGSSVKVYSIDEDTNVIGDKMFSEGYHKGRVYYVKGDSKVYQSHLSGTGRGQPDSFPFDIDTQFGFFETFKSEENLTVSITPQDELVIGTKRKAYVYFIQGGQGTVLRILKAINGGQSVIDAQAMLSDLEGQPEATVLAWYNEEGFYLSPGGVREPQDVIKATHKNYWLEKANKEDIVMFFNKAKKEIWLAFPNKEIMIYELDYNKWKRYAYPFAITQYIGNINNDLYVLGDDNKMYKVDFGNNLGLTGYVTTHYSTDTLMVDRYPISAPEHELKVLQELFVAFNKRSTGIFEYTIIADGNTYDPINMYPSNFNDLTLSPQLVVYGKVKIKLKIPAVGAWVREFGYHFSSIERSPGQIVQPSKTGIGMNTGLQLGVHQ